MLRPGKDPAFDKAIAKAKDQVLADVAEFLEMLEKSVRSGLFLKCAKYDNQGFALANMFFSEINEIMQAGDFPTPPNIPDPPSR